MRVLVIGGTGFLSKKIVKELLNKLHTVSVFNRGESPNLLQQDSNLKFIKGNRDNIEDLQKVLTTNVFDAVYDMIAYTENQSKDAVHVFKGRIGRFIHCSTISVYMISNDVQCPITEDQSNKKIMDYFARNPFGMDYGINKRRCEDILWNEHNDITFPVTILRPTFIAGPEDPSKRDFFWIQRMLDQKPLLIPGSGDFAFQQVFIDDVAKAFCDILDYEITNGNAYNIAAEEVYSLNEYITNLSELLNLKPEIVHIDQEVFDQLDISYSPEGDVFPYNTKRTAIFSLEKIKKDINYKSTPFNEWMTETIEWFVNNQNGNSFGYENRNKEIDVINNWKNDKERILHL